MPTPATSFDAMDFASNGAGHPPDTVGDVGPNHFVQAVNTSIGIYNKTTGAAISTFTFNSLWSGAGTGTPCDTSHNGDPTVVYDPQHDRFIVADFSWTDIMNGPYYECIAVSKTSDPVAGGWWLFAFRADDAAHPWLPDYPKMGIWPDGLYMSANMFDCVTAGCGSATYEEVRVYALNIDDLVSGAVLRSIVVDTSPGIAGPISPCFPATIAVRLRPSARQTISSENPDQSSPGKSSSSTWTMLRQPIRHLPDRPTYLRPPTRRRPVQCPSLLLVITLTHWPTGP